MDKLKTFSSTATGQSHLSKGLVLNIFSDIVDSIGIFITQRWEALNEEKKHMNHSGIWCMATLMTDDNRLLSVPNENPAFAVKRIYVLALYRSNISRVITQYTKIDM